jgi:carboxymethylenebutenolidase
MGELISFSGANGPANGYLALPESGEGPGVIVIQEWWGLVDHIKDVCDRFAGEGFVALAPDLYHGVATKEPDEAAKAMMALRLDDAALDMGAAVDELLKRTGRKSVGVIGFCMGGGLALYLATKRPDAVRACVPCYGVIPWPDAQVNYAAMSAAVEGHYAENDGSAPPAVAKELEATLRAAGKEATIVVHPGTEHAFFNDDRPEVYNEEQAHALWSSALSFFRRMLD